MCSLFMVILYHKYVWRFLVYTCIFLHICFEYSSHIPCKYFHRFSFGCILNYSVNSQSGHDKIQTVHQRTHFSGLEMTFDIFSIRFCMVSCGEAKKETPQNHTKPPYLYKTQARIQKLLKEYTKQFLPTVDPII